MALVISTQGFYERNVKTDPLLAEERATSKAAQSQMM
jgi:hypothetical protein